MDNARLNQILEETMGLLGQYPGLIDQHHTPLSPNIETSMAVDLSYSVPSSRPSGTEQQEIDEVPSFESVLSRKYQLFESLSSNWFKHNREYQDIMYQMNSISHQLMQNIIGETVNVPINSGQPPSLLYPTGRNAFLFSTGNGNVPFSIPLRRSPLFEQPPPDNDMLFPTIRQLLTATEIYNYSTETETSTDQAELTCPITLEEFENGELLCRIRYCRHVFKWKYLQEWFCTSSHCPVCRYDIRTYSSGATAV